MHGYHHKEYVYIPQLDKCLQWHDTINHTLVPHCMLSMLVVNRSMSAEYQMQVGPSQCQTTLR